MNDAFLDGNSAAGPLSEIFAVDLTAARGRCNHCGTIAALADTRVWSHAPGIVLRCHSCGGVLARFVAAPDGRSWLDLRGLSFLEFRSA